MSNYKSLFNNFDDRLIVSANAIFESLFERPTEYVLEHRYANLRLPRQCGKSRLLTSIANNFAARIHEPNLNVLFVDGLNLTPRTSHGYRLDRGVEFFGLTDESDLCENKLMRFRGTKLDLILFDEVKPNLAVKFLKNNIIVPAYAHSTNFVAFGLHTMDTVGI